MLLGSEAADISAYNMIEGNIYNIFNLVYNKIGNINQGSKVTQALADIDGDGYYEMAVGNERGGLVFTIQYSEKIQCRRSLRVS